MKKKTSRRDCGPEDFYALHNATRVPWIERGHVRWNTHGPGNIAGPPHKGCLLGEWG